MELTYMIDGERTNVQVPDESDFFTGDEVVLADISDDIARCAEWYEQGYSVVGMGQDISFPELQASITDLVKQKVSEAFPEKDLDSFELSRYHEFVSQSEHVEKIDSRIKRFFWDDINFDDEPLIALIESEIGRKLSYTPAGADDPHWIIVRINMPGSRAFNPAHKDIYEGFDRDGVCPAMINAWVPICGVSQQAGLSVAPRSHLIPESKIRRTTAGSSMNGNKYFVNCIHSWDGIAELKTIAPKQEEMLIFSSHLIHGLGRNQCVDQTRVALEFRLHAQ